jgi:hypothetical protein
MIVELTTTEVKPRSLSGAMASFECALPARQLLSPLGGLWRSDAGALNQIIEIWPYESIEHRTHIQGEPSAMRNWPPDIGEVVVDRRTLVLESAPFSPPIVERKLGVIYEFRFYTYRKGAFEGIVERWAPSIERRVKFSPVVGVWYCEEEDVGNLVHVWAYRDANDWQSIRHAMLKTDFWPAKGRAGAQDLLLRQTSMIALPASFSPLR